MSVYKVNYLNNFKMNLAEEKSWILKWEWTNELINELINEA
jgi:hypothetical protein